ncbi:MAG: hypothetical protein LBO77_04950 [Desulfovibrio sp.]|jgi:hypothetical protein|nr:hypothetical protein [Desulfovibrio sp.]
MPNDPTSSSLDPVDTDDDDEIVDLLEVVKPGRKIPVPAPSVDFGADLDAMLGQIAEAEKALDAADSSSAARPVPFPDPTPVDHAVDPDETLNMPGMDDLDSLMSSLGANAVSPQPAPAAPKTPPSPVPDLDAIPILQDQTAQAFPPAAPPPTAAPYVPLDPASGPPPASLSRPASSTPAQAASSPALPGGDGAQALLAPARAEDRPSLPREESLPPEIRLLDEPETGREEPDPLLVADLPDMESLFAPDIPKPPPSLPDIETLFGQDLPTATAAESAAPAAESAAPEALPAAPAAESAAPAEPDQDCPPPAARYDEVDLNELDTLLENILAAAPPSSSAPGMPEKEDPGLAPVREALFRMETGLEDLRGEIREKNVLLEKQQSRLTEQAAQIEELRNALSSLHGNLDKMAALSAARVIREELVSLLNGEAAAP